MTNQELKSSDVEEELSIEESQVDLHDPKLYINRETSWLEFNKRVLKEAQSKEHPLLERVKFISIFSSNLDEFFMIRVAGLESQYEAGVVDRSLDGLAPLEQLEEIKARTIDMIEERNRCFYNDIVKRLHQEGILFLEYQKLKKNVKDALSDYFDAEIFPVLTPLAFDPGHPFPYVSNLSLSLAVQLKDKDSEQPKFARVKVPSTLPRLVRLDKIMGAELENGALGVVWLEDIIGCNLNKLFPDLEIEEVHPFRVIRDADIEIEEDEAGDLLETIEQGIRKRRYGTVVRLDVNPGMPEYIKQILMDNLRVSDRKVYEISRSLNLASVIELLKVNRPDLKDEPFVPKDHLEERLSIFDEIKRRHILLYHPYDSFQPVVDFIQQAAEDPDVLAIKQTLYRVGDNSPIVKALIEAAERGKQVAVLVELKARFDEENNIVWARALEKVGVHVVYGLIGLKVHAKVALVVRREASGLRRYVHLGTGNYNPSTAKIYTDYSFLTCDSKLTADASEVFNYLTGYSNRKTYQELIVSPYNTRPRIIEMIERETEHQKTHQNGRIIIKCNSLVDTKTIKALYKASQEGVKIDLIIRGVCILKPGIEGLSERIRVISIVGRFLEHSRVFYFSNNGNDEVYLGSADVMQRNLDRRVEVVFPVKDPELKARVKSDLDLMLNDNQKAWELGSDGSFRKVSTDETTVINSQKILITGQHFQTN